MGNWIYGNSVSYGTGTFRLALKIDTVSVNGAAIRIRVSGGLQFNGVDSHLNAKLDIRYANSFTGATYSNTLFQGYNYNTGINVDDGGSGGSAGSNTFTWSNWQIYEQDLGTNAFSLYRASYNITITLAYEFEGQTYTVQTIQTMPIKANYTVIYHENLPINTPPSAHQLGDQIKWYNEDLVLERGIDVYDEQVGTYLDHWNTEQNDQGNYYRLGGTYVNNANLDLYGIWLSKTFTITYNGNGATHGDPPGAQTKYYGESIILYGQSSLLKDGHSFAGWDDDPEADPDNPRYIAYGFFSQDEDTVLYAIWKRGSSTISYRGNGGSGVPPDQIKPYGEDIYIPNIEPTKAGCLFQGWSEIMSAMTPRYHIGDPITTDSDLILYAVWVNVPDIPSGDEEEEDPHVNAKFWTELAQNNFFTSRARDKDDPEHPYEKKTNWIYVSGSNGLPELTQYVPSNGLANAVKLKTVLGTVNDTGVDFNGSSNVSIPVSGILGVNNGGTGVNLWTKNGILYASAADTLSNTIAGTMGYVLTSGGDNNPPTWTQATNTNIANTLVKRDAQGNFNGNTVTANIFSATSGTIKGGTLVTSNYGTAAPSGAPSSGVGTIYFQIL